MNIRHQFLITLLLTGVGFCNLLGQDEPYKGGSGDGFSSDTIYLDFLDLTMGGNGDGFSSITILLEFNDFYIGGVGDGFSEDQFLNTFNDYARGGNADGFSFDTLLNEYNVMYVGGNFDGFSYDTTQTIFNPMYTGGNSDGFAYDKYGHIIFWTGIASTGWNVAGNWENGIIPTYCNPVVIPAGVPNFPAVNAGLLRIGYYKNEGDYKCQQLKINAGAEMLTRVNCFVENYDLIFNRGKLFVKNPATNAFKNLGDGIVQIKSNAEIIFKE